MHLKSFVLTAATLKSTVTMKKRMRTGLLNKEREGGIRTAPYVSTRILVLQPRFYDFLVELTLN